MSNSDRSIVGDLINFRGLVYAPLNENGVIFLFGKIAGDLNMYVEEIKPGFPDCIARRFTGRGWEKVRVEFEFKSSNFLDHGHNPSQCDLIICWEHNWQKCPLEVLELKSEIQTLPNSSVKRPDGAVSEGTVMAIFEKRGVPANVRRLYERLEEKIISNEGDRIWWKVGTQMVNFFSPRRQFASVHPRKDGLLLSVFTRGLPLGGVEPVKPERVGGKWGRLLAKSEADLDPAAAVCVEARKRMEDAVDAHEPAGWLARAESEIDEESENETQDATGAEQ